ncbi:putative -like family protein [Eutypa lata UCREL1]|uniref:Putative-like family protein n=1 Tax=Eutypa lata (strain UCR-EL1) TaxID=1287681 RepID=M7SHQ1_EUTLA|nr:putative -like family protein [Eutypa lata UCREL1]
MAIKKVALIGATGNLGSELLEALVSSGSFDVTVIQRASSKSKPSVAGTLIPTKTVDDALSLASLQAAFAGQDAVVVSFPLRDHAAHLRIADAAAAAGVARVIPADYGSCDSGSARAQELVPLFKHKTAVRDRLQALAAENPGFAWTSLVNGHFFDWGLRQNFLHFDLEARTADLLDGGVPRSSTATLGRIAEAVVRVLQKADDARTKNRVLFVQSFCVSQLDVLGALERATGGKEWKVNRYDAEEFIREHKIKADAGDKEAVEDLVFALGAIDGNWEEREGFAMDLLGLENEDLDEVVKRVVDSQG